MTTYVEDTNIPVHNTHGIKILGLSTIGDLWNCHESVACGNLFGSSPLQDCVLVAPKTHTECCFTHLKSTREEIKKFNINGELALDILCGLIPVNLKGRKESNAEENAQKEEFYLHYSQQSFEIKLHHSASRCLDQVTVGKILAGDIKATHVVQTILTGAEVIANISVSSSLSNESTDRGGSVSFATGKSSSPSQWAKKLRKLCGFVSIKSCKAELEKLDKNSATNLNKTCRISSTLALKQPTTISDMFTIFDEIPSKLNEQRNYGHFSPDITGTAVGYLLVPVKQFIRRAPIERLYLRLRQETLNAIEEMLITLMDYQRPGYIQDELLSLEPKMRMILSDPRNDITNKVRSFERDLSRRAHAIRDNTVEKFKLYKIKGGEVKLEDLLEQFHTEFDTSTILQRVYEFLEEGRSDPTMNFGPSQNTSMEIFTNHNEFQSWQSNTLPKIYLQTKSLLSFVAVDLFRKIHGKFHSAGIKVGILSSTISQDFSISFKTVRKSQTYSSEDVMFVLNVLSISSGICEDRVMEFHKLMVTKKKIPLPVSSVEDIISLITIIKPSQHVIVCESCLETRSKISVLDDRFKFVFTLTGIELLDFAEFEIGDKLIGYFNIPDTKDAPKLFLFKNGNLLAMCFDMIDVILLTCYLLKREEVPDLDVLTPKLASKNCFSQKQYDFARDVIELFADTNSTSNVLNLPSGIEKVLDAVDTCISRDVTFKQFENLLIAFKDLDLDIDTHRYLWQSNKFLQFTKLFSNSSNFLLLVQSIYSHSIQCLPSNIQNQLLANQENLKMDTIAELIEIFETIGRNGKVPTMFNESLTETLRNKPEIFELLRNSECLTDWNYEGKFFNFPWNNQAIEENLKLIKNYLKNRPREPSTSVAEPFNFHLNVSHIPESHPLETNHGRQEASRRWIQLTGQKLPQITLQSFVQIRSLVEAPKIDRKELNQRFPDIIKYIIQEIKMWRVAAIFPVEIAKYINKTDCGDPEPKKLGKLNFQARAQQSTSPSTVLNANEHALPLSRLDILICLLSNCYPPVCRDIIHIIGKYPVSLPMVVQDITEDKRYVSFTPYLQNMIFKWESKGRPGFIVHNYLFQSPFRLTLVVRVGISSSGKPGKGTILNRLFATEHAFSSRSEPGGVHGKPLLLDGTVELMPVTNESCTRDFWNWSSADIPGIETHYNNSNELLLLANLHGCALEHSEIILYLKPMISSVVVFYMTQSASELEANYTQLKSEEFFGHLGEDNIFNVLIDPSADCETMSDDVLDTSKLLDHSMIEKLYQLIMGSYRSKVNNSGQSVPLPNIKLVPEIKTSQSSDLLSQITSCKRLRQTFKLQKLKTCEQDFHRYHQLWNDDKILQTIVSLFINILSMPIEHRRIGLYHFEKEISLHSMAESQELRQDYLALKFKRMELAAIGYEDEMAKLDEISESVLGPQHFFRELGRIYCLAHSTRGFQDRSLDAIRNLPNYYGELIIDGLPIELLDGDESNISDLWFCAIAHSVCEIKKNLRVFVISILGLQSSGKSTLLNALFGCQFDVSVGRCTRGLFIRLLFLEQKLVKELRYDAFLIIDSEGLGSPEQISDQLAEEKDRRMATFAMSISNLTIINILGESSNEMNEILQVVIIAMARLAEANIATQVLRVQHVTEKEESKLSAAEEQFFKTLSKAINLAENKSTQTGTVNSSILRNIKQSLGEKRLVKYFGNFKSGTAPNAAPSEQYQNDIVDLYQMILQSAKESREYVNFCEWHDLAVSYWKALQNEDFAVKFKNIKEMCDFLDQVSKISNINDLTDSSFRHHRTKMEDEIRKEIEENPKFVSNYFLGVLENNLKKILVMCTSGKDPYSQCDFCSSVEKAKHTLFAEMAEKPDLPKTRESIQRYEDSVRQNTLKRLEQAIHATRVQKGCLKEVDEIIIAEITQRLKIQNEYSMKEREVITDEIWKKLQEIVTQRRTIDSLDDRILHQIKLAYNNADSEIIKGFLKKTGPILDKTEAFDCKKNPWNNKKNKQKHMTLLKDQINQIVNNVFSESGTNNLENGMIKRLQYFVDGICEEWGKTNKNPFRVEFKNALHIAALRAFSREANKKEKYWMRANDPLTILNDNENTFKKTIRVRLEYGFTSESEGTIIADRLLMAMFTKAKAAGSRRWTEDVLGQNWIRTPRHVRLHYFTILAEGILRGRTTPAVFHFISPLSEFSIWFGSLVDSYSQDGAKQTFLQTIKREKQYVIDKINQATTAAQIIQDVTHYVSSADGVSYDCKIKNISQFDENHTKRLKNCIINSIEGYCFGAVIFELPSNDEEVLNRTGCTERCPLCGALCWGRRGHDRNTDETGKHHTSHQPSGLYATSDLMTKNLTTTSCSEISDKTKIHREGEYLGEWTNVKATSKYNNWIYIAHSQVEFDDLMKWFFQQIHSEIATECGRNPAKLGKIKEWRISSIDTILSTIRAKICQS